MPFSQEQKQVMKVMRRVVGGEIPDSDFKTPQEWAERGEDYGLKSVLVVLHDGGNQAPYLNLDYCAYKCHEKMAEALRDIGYYVEQCTCWYSAVYKA